MFADFLIFLLISALSDANICFSSKSECYLDGIENLSIVDLKSPNAFKYLTNHILREKAVGIYIGKELYGSSTVEIPLVLFINRDIILYRREDINNQGTIVLIYTESENYNSTSLYNYCFNIIFKYIGMAQPTYINLRFDSFIYAYTSDIKFLPVEQEFALKSKIIDCSMCCLVLKNVMYLIIKLVLPWDQLVM